jgi:CBS domain-containing protein
MISCADISAAIQVRHLQVELSDAMTFSTSDSADEASERMRARGFDQAPVLASGRLVGVVGARDLQNGAVTVADVFTPISAQQPVSAHAPVSDALHWLLGTRCLCVLDGRRVSGFVMEADLNKQPMCTRPEPR